MTTKLTVLASLLFATAIAGPAAAAPDFVGGTPPPSKYPASDARTPIAPEDDVAFALDSEAILEAPREQIATAARWLKANPKYNIVLEGHADSTGTPQHNADLALRRADMVRMLLIGHGVHSDRILILVYGEARAKRVPSPIDRRVVLYATHERLATIVRREMRDQQALDSIYTKRGVQYTETHGITPGAVASR